MNDAAGVGSAEGRCDRGRAPELGDAAFTSSSPSATGGGGSRTTERIGVSSHFLHDNGPPATWSRSGGGGPPTANQEKSSVHGSRKARKSKSCGSFLPFRRGLQPQKKEFTKHTGPQSRLAHTRDRKAASQTAAVQKRPSTRRMGRNARKLNRQWGRSMSPVNYTYLKGAFLIR